MNILFLCTGNSCRSQIAEGWTRHLGNKDITAQSAGIDISQQESTQVTDAMLDSADIVVTVCGHADEHCPALPPGKRKIHWPLEDPARASGSEAEIMQVFRASRDDIRQRVQDLINKLSSPLQEPS